MKQPDPETPEDIAARILLDADPRTDEDIIELTRKIDQAIADKFLGPEQ